MRRYIFAERGGIYLIDLKKTLRELNRARDLVNGVVRGGGNVLFVCTKPQLKGLVRAEAERAGAFYVTERWLGGLLTNFQTIKKNIRRLKDLERGVEEGAFEFYTKKERLLLDREREKLERYLSGIKDMTRLPGLVFVVDANKEEIAVREANRLGIPVVAIADTNADPDMLTVAIAGNDDAIRSVSLITGVMAEEILMARREAPDAAGDKDEGTALTYSSDAGGTEPVDGKRKKRPKRRPRPELIKRRRHASDPEAGVPEGDDVDGESESTGNDEIVDVELSLAEAVEAPPEDLAEVEEVAVTAEAVPGEDGDGKDPGSP
jgi:small subunit ribosomal protein S2